MLRRPVTTRCLLLLAALQSSPTPAVTLHAAQPLGNNRYLLQGEFGERCATCEVIVEYADGLHYAARVEHWMSAGVVTQLPDLNRNLNVSVRLRTVDGLSEALSLRLTRAIVPRPELDTPAPPELIESAEFVERTHSLAVGDKGEEILDMSAPPPECATPAPLFDRARIVYADRRFGEAQIVELPPAGCTKCPPLVVRWYHEPTGRLTYQVHIYKRIVEGICPERIR